MYDNLPADEKKDEKAKATHKHVFDSTVDNPADPPARKVCACGHWEPIKK